MPASVTINDESLSGEVLNSFTLDSLTEKLTVRELIRARIYQEVDDHNRSESLTFRGLVQPSNAEKVMNGYKFKRPKMINWETQYKKACEAFEKNGFFVIIGDRQAESLDEEFEVKVDAEISFVKLVPLVGG